MKILGVVVTAILMRFRKTQNSVLFEISLCAQNLEIRQDLKPVQIQQDQKGCPNLRKPKTVPIQKTQKLVLIGIKTSKEKVSHIDHSVKIMAQRLSHEL